MILPLPHALCDRTQRLQEKGIDGLMGFGDSVLSQVSQAQSAEC